MCDDAILSVFLQTKLVEVLLWNGKEDIISIGDSHAALAIANIPRCRIMTIGSITMHRVTRDGLQSFGIAANQFPPHQNIVLSLGEIDCRMHIVKQSERQQRPFSEIVLDLVNRYFVEIHKTFSARPDLRIIVSGVVPALRARNAGEGFYYGDDTLRRTIHAFMNQCIQQKCAAYGYDHLDVFSKYVDEEGFIRYSLSDHSHHLGPQCAKLIEHDLTTIIGTGRPPG